MKPLEKERYLKRLEELEALVDRLRTGDGLESEFEKYRNIYRWIKETKESIENDYKTSIGL